MANKSKRSNATRSKRSQPQKVKLRTSLDVFNRITYDSSLPLEKEHVLIGYVDNGAAEIKTRPFLNWTLIQNGGDFPMHLIVYFKYKNIILWDKRTRLDRLYGSGNTSKSQLLSNKLARTPSARTTTTTNQSQIPIINSNSNQGVVHCSDFTISIQKGQNELDDDTIRITDKFVFFFGGCLSQHFMSPITINNVTYNCCEQYMMSQKAKLFGDDEIYQQIMNSDDPKEQKKLGRRVDQFREKEWQRHREQVIYDANYAKYTQNNELREKLLSFGDRMFVEASRSDKVYGIGLSLKSRKADTKSNWKGLNLLGLAITKVRDQLLLSPSDDDDDDGFGEEKMECKSTIESACDLGLEFQEKTDCDHFSDYNDLNEGPLTDHLDAIINFVESKVSTIKSSKTTKSSKMKESSKLKESTKSTKKSKTPRKRRLSYLMKEQQDRLWNIFKTKYKYTVPSIDTLRRTFRTDLNYLNVQCTEILNGDRIKFEDIHFIFHTIFSKRKRDPNVVDRSPKEWSRIFESYPVDNEGYGVSFQFDDHTQWLPMLKRYGFVVISKVLSDTECDQTVDAMIEEMNLRNQDGLTIDLDDPKTWEKKYWPSTRKFLTNCPAFHPIAFRNRFNHKIETVFSTIFGTNQLNVSVDNWGFNRPYKTRINSNSGKSGSDDGDYVFHPKWQHSLKPHWDYSPWLFVQEMERGYDPGYQGIVALNDHNTETGCHRNLPRGIHHMKAWTVEHRYPYSDKMKYKQYDEGNMKYIQKSEKPKEDDPIIEYMQNVPIRKGDLIIWSWGQLHANTPNTSDQWRFVQYIRMFPAPNVHPNYAMHDQYAPQRVINNKKYRGYLFDGKLYRNEKEFESKLKLTQRERRLLGMEQY